MSIRETERSVNHPFQRILASRPSSEPRTVYLASKGKLMQARCNDGSVIGSWQADEKSSITLLSLSDDGQYLAAVTGEEKLVHIFNANGLEHLSQRNMPKRPCAITFSPDDDHVLCGDKFGDVYALPLQPHAEDANAASKPEVPRPSFPAATNLTVHSARNLRALENQQKQLSQKAASKSDKMVDAKPVIKQEPILGHVSMLTDLISIRRQADVEEAKDGIPAIFSSSFRDYIMTCDRDEHIRVSRGLPQAHVIEGFCLGHTQFVSKMCLVKQDVLVSGGGDDYLLIWDWIHCKSLSRVAMRPAFNLIHQTGGVTTGSERLMAVSGLWQAPHSTETNASIIMCALEGTSAVFHFCYKEGLHDTKFIANMLHGNLLDVAIVGDVVICSIDNVHAPGSTTEVREGRADVARLQALHFHNGEMHPIHVPAAPISYAVSIDALNQHGATIDGDSTELKQLASLLYQIESIRKRGKDDAEE